MQDNLSILIDTNILVHLEDNKEVTENCSELIRLCQKHKIDVFIHEKALEDISRDPNKTRKSITLTKQKKYQTLPSSPATQDELEALFGKIKKANDLVDTSLLYSLYTGSVSILVTEDKGILKRAIRSGEDLSCYTVTNAVEFIRTLKEPIAVAYPFIEDKFCFQLNLKSTFFDTLRGDYKGFDNWYKKCNEERRNCWVIPDGNNIAGLLIRKDENQENVKELNVPGNKILKAALFKISENSRGERYGEQLLKQAMDYCFRNKYETLYLTTYPHQSSLISMLLKFGFQQGKNKAEEQVYYKECGKVLSSNLGGFDFHRKHWPQIKVNSSTRIHFIPIQPRYHKRLFPEHSSSKDSHQLLLPIEDKPPGNAIRKIYISKSKYTKLKRGDLLLFYKSKDSIITSIGVVESANFAENLASLITLAGNRTVYSESELVQILAECGKPLAINFYFSFHLETPISLEKAKEIGILKAQPQSLSELQNQKFQAFYEELSKQDRNIFNYE